MNDLRDTLRTALVRVEKIQGEVDPLHRRIRKGTPTEVSAALQRLEDLHDEMIGALELLELFSQSCRRLRAAMRPVLRDIERLRKAARHRSRNGAS